MQRPVNRLASSASPAWGPLVKRAARSGFLAGEPTTRQEAAKLWRSIADAVGIEAGSRMGTHSFRRAFANRLRNVPMRELKDLGGWKTEKTVIGTYLQPD